MAGISINATVGSSTTPYAVLQQSSSSGLGDIWNNVGAAWETSPTVSNRKIAMSSSGVTGVFEATTANLASYTGWVHVTIHDDVNDEPLAAGDAYISGGDEANITATDITAIPTAVRTELNSNPVPASNMRGTDNSMLAATWVAPDNAGITSIQSTLSSHGTTLTTIQTDAGQAKTAAQSVDAKLPADTTAKLANLDAAITTRSTVTDASIRAHLQANPVDAANMRGTDNAFLAASWVAPDNANIVVAASDATAAKTAAESADGKLPADTTAKFALFPATTIAAATDITAIQNVLTSKISGVADALIPGTGSQTRRFYLTVRNSDGTLNDPDSNNVTWTAANGSGTDRSSNLTGPTRASAGSYYVDYTIASTHAEEEITLTASFAENAVSTKELHVFGVVDPATVTAGFTSADRSKLDAMHAKLPSKTYLVGTNAADGDINVDEFDGDITAFHANQTTVINAARDAILTQGDAAWTTATGFLSTSDTRLNNLDATISSRAAATATTSIQADTTQLITDVANVLSTGNSSWATATGFLTSTDARLNNLDAAISACSTFDHTTDMVELATGHGLATATDQAAIKAKTDNLPSDPAGVSNIPTTGAIASHVNTTLESEHGSGTWDSTGDATLSNQNTIITQLTSIGAQSVISANIIDDSRTWVLSDRNERMHAPEIVTLQDGDIVELAMDFDVLLNPGTSIATVTAVTDSEELLTISDLTVGQNKRSAQFKVANVAAGGQHILKVTVTTTDAQTFSGLGALEVQGDSPLTNFGINNIVIGV